MSGQVYFGNHGDVTLLRVFHNLFGLFLRIEAAVRGVVVFPASCFADDGAVAHGADFRQLRIFLYFDSPALVVRQVPVEGIHVVQRQQVDILFYEFEREEVPAYVEMHAAVCKAGFVFDVACRYRNIGSLRCGGDGFP